MLEYLSLQDAGCPIMRHELTNFQWQMLGVLKNEREKITIEAAKENSKNRPPLKMED